MVSLLVARRPAAGPPVGDVIAPHADPHGRPTAVQRRGAGSLAGLSSVLLGRLFV